MDQSRGWEETLSPGVSHSSIMSEDSVPLQTEAEDSSTEDSFGFGDDLELNPFDGLPFSSRYYHLLKERKSLPVWRLRCGFEDALATNQMLIVSGAANTGRSTQVKATWLHLRLPEGWRRGGGGGVGGNQSF